MQDTTAFREAMSRFPSGIVIATTLGAEGQPEGFTASSFCSVSLDPPLILVCLAKTARSHAAFSAAERFAVNILRPEHEHVASRFGRRGSDKFAGQDFEEGPHGLPLLGNALVSLVCTREALLPGGDHSILLGRVDEVSLGAPGPALVHHERGYRVVSGGTPAA